MNLSRVDLNLLPALDALLRERNITRAGQQIGLSQPAMSSALARLRRLFDDEILVRAGREYHLTALARELEEPLREIMGLIEGAIERRPRFDPATDHRAFSIAASDYAALMLLQPALERIGAEAPGVTLQLHPFRAPLPEMLERGEVDLFIVPRQTTITFPGETLFTDRWVCAVCANHPEIGERLSLQTYLELPHLAYAVDAPQRIGLGDKQVDALNVKRRVFATFESFLLLPFLLRGTRLVTLIHERLGLRVREAAGIKLLDPPFPMEGIAEAMFWHPRSNADPGLQWLRKLLAEVASTL